MTAVQYKAIIAMTVLFLVYFQSELILRQAALSLVDRDKIKIDNVISKLPSNVRDGIKKQIEMASRRDAVLSAKNDSERVAALVSLALTLDDSPKRDSIFAEIVETYPKMPESLAAYSGLLRNDKSPRPVSIGEYHEFIRGLAPEQRLHAWTSGLNSLRQNRPKDKQQHFDFLKPLLDITPEYNEYYALYDSLYGVALDIGDESAKNAAELKRDQASELPSVDSALIPSIKKK